MYFTPISWWNLGSQKNSPFSNQFLFVWKGQLSINELIDNLHLYPICLVLVLRTICVCNEGYYLLLLCYSIVIHIWLCVLSPLLCTRSCVTGGRRCVPPPPTQPSLSQGEPVPWCVCGTWLRPRTKSPAWSSSRSVFFLLFFFFPVLLFPQCPAHLDFSLTATVRSHGRCDVPGCVRGPQHDRERLPRPHLHPVGPGGAELHHPANWTRSRRLSSGVQRPHRKRPHPFAATFFANPVRSLRKKQFILLTDTQIHWRIYYCICLGVKTVFFPSLQGEIASCAGPVIYLWNMKGHLLTSIDASCGPQPDIQCVLFTQRHEWDPKNVIVTGCTDGIIRVKTFFLHACMHVFCTEDVDECVG